MPRCCSRSAAAAATSGILLALAFPSVDWEWLAWFALAPLVVVVARAERTRDAFWPGYLAGAVFFGFSCPWIDIVVHRYGGLGAALSALVFALFLALMGVYVAGFAAVAAWLGRRTGHRYLPQPFVWVGMEWLRTYTPMGGFPWNLLGYTQIQHSGFMLSATVAGIYGASFLIILENTLLAALAARFYDAGRQPHGAPRTRAAASEAIGVGAVLAFALFPYHPPRVPAGALTVRMVQPDTPLDRSWSAAAVAAFLERQAALSTGAAEGPAAGQSPDLILWPEQPAPLFWELDPRLRAATAEIQRQTHAALLLEEVAFATLPDGEPDENQPFNSALLLEPGGGSGGRYDKMHLVPFGEYVPLAAWLQRRNGIGHMLSQAGDFIPGRRRVVFAIPGGRFAVLICYESIFPEPVREDVRAGAQWLVNLSDDGWYGHSSAAAQDEAMARARAIENRRWLLRDTNDGYTAAIDPYGRITARLPHYTAAALEATWSPENSTTFYTRHGDWLAYGCLGMMGILTAAALGRRRPNHRHAA